MKISWIVMQREKNLSIELLKFLAVLLVANHWMSPLYVKWKMLSTGGAIGDVLFFFASGYTLFLGRFGRFDNWYKRRIKRIYPSIIAFAALLSCTGIEQMTVKQIILGGAFWFVSCIMIYYVILYFVRKYEESRPLIPFVISTIVIIGGYLSEDSSRLFMYGETYFKWCHYFLFMLLGAYLGNKTIELKSRPMLDGITLLLMLIIFYGLQLMAGKSEMIAYLQILSLLPLMGIVVCIYKLCSASGVDAVMKTKVGFCIRFIAGLCLEVYIVSNLVIKSMIGKFDNIFPLNLIVTFCLIVVAAYVTRCVARVFLQIFEKEDMNWKVVLKLV